MVGNAAPLLAKTIDKLLEDQFGVAKAGSLKDLGKGEWRRYVCFEAAAIGRSVSAG